MQFTNSTGAYNLALVGVCVVESDQLTNKAHPAHTDTCPYIHTKLVRPEWPCQIIQSTQKTVASLLNYVGPPMNGINQHAPRLRVFRLLTLHMCKETGSNAVLYTAMLQSYTQSLAH